MRQLWMLFVMVFVLSCGRTDDGYESDFQQRSQWLIQQVADHYTPPSFTIGDPEKYYWPKAMARFEKYGLEDSLANYYITRLSHRSPFHFTLVGMARLMSLYPESNAMKENKELLLQKVFERTDSHNAWTSEGTENHLAMDRTSGYIFAQHALKYPETFPQAQQKLDLIKDWITRWSKQLYEFGSGEWNSSTYQGYHVISWLNIYDFAHDQEVKEMAKAVLDYYAAETALHYSWGGYGGSEKRGRGATNSNHSSGHYLAWLWFGYDDPDRIPHWQRAEYIQSMHAVTSSYRPSTQIRYLANKNLFLDQWYTNSKPSYLFEVPSFVKQFYYIGDGYTLGSAVSPYGGYTGSTSQIVNWHLIVKPGEDNYPVEVSGNGGFNENRTGMTANPWTQFAQYRNVLIQLTRTPENKNDIIELARDITQQWAIDWQHDFSLRFPGDNRSNVVNFMRNIRAENLSYITLPESEEFYFLGNSCFVDLGNAFAVFRFINASEPTAETHLVYQNDRAVLTDTADDGQLCGFVMEVSPSNQWDSFQNFVASAQAGTSLEIGSLGVNYRSLQGDKISMSFSTSGTFTEAIYDWGYGAVEPQTFVTSPPFIQPVWPRGEGFGKIPGVVINDQIMDLTGKWHVFDGPLMSLKDQMLRVKDDRSVYEVNFTGSVPTFENRRR